MRVRAVWVVAMFGMVGSAFASEPSCYRSSAEAAAQSGVRGVEGFRLEAVRRDSFSGTSWATVKSCAHPEWPGTLVMVSAWSAGAGASVAHAQRSDPGVAKALAMQAGTRVRYVETSGNVRLEVSAVAQASGAIGDQVRVRLVPVSGEGSADGGSSWSGSERFAIGIVRSRDVVEMVAE
jgi:hypothetical protein